MTAPTDDATPPRDGSPTGREARLAQALRANLQRRKAQARARADGPDDAGDVPAASVPGPGEAAPNNTEGKD